MKRKENLSTYMDKISAKKVNLRNKLDSKKNTKTTKVISNTASRYFELLESENECKTVKIELEKCLEKQKELTSLYEEITPLNNGESLINKPSRRLYNLQMVFCDIENHFSLANEENIEPGFENELIKLIIINPEKISDELLVNLGIEDEDFLKLPYHTRLQKKINNIKRIKELLSNTVSLSIDNEKNIFTGRIMICTKKGEPSLGNIILIQNNEDSVNESSKNIFIHDNIYSFLRSQTHTENSIKEREKEIRQICDTLKGLVFLTKKSDTHIREMILNLIENQIKKLEKFKSKKLKKAIEILKKISINHTADDYKNLNNAINIILNSVQNSVSQRTNIYRHTENIKHILSSYEKNWQLLKKHFKELITELEEFNPDLIIEEFKNLPDDFKNGYSGLRKEKVQEIKEKLSLILNLDIDELAKIEAYFWSKEDEKNGKNTSPKTYQDYQYFEALKQKKEHRDTLSQKENNKLQFYKKTKDILEKNDFQSLISKIEGILMSFNDSKNSFCPYPFSFLYGKILNETKKLKISISSNDLIGIYRAILSINLCIKEYDFLIFLSKLESNIELEEIGEKQEIRDKFIGICNNKIKNITKKDFLKKINFDKKSDISIKFSNYLKIFNTIRRYIEIGEYSELINYIKGLQLKK